MSLSIPENQVTGKDGRRSVRKITFQSITCVLSSGLTWLCDASDTEATLRACFYLGRL